jgi:hypothetical protein
MKWFIQFLLILSLLAGFMGGSSQPVEAQDDIPETMPIPISITSSSDKGIVFDVNVDWQRLTAEPVIIDGIEFTRVSLPDASPQSRAGLPDLPILIKTLAVPFGVQVDIEVTPNFPHTYQLSAPVLPGQTQTSVLPLPGESETPGFTPEVISSYDMDGSIYKLSRSYPGSFGEISNDGVIRQQRVAGITLFPVQYVPTSGQLTVYENLHVEVTFKGTPDIAPKKAAPESDVYEDFFQTNLLNYRESADWRLPEESITKTDINPSTTGSLPWVPPDPGWRIKVQQTGFYRVTYAELQTAGLDVDNLDPATFQVFHLGTEMAIEVEGEADASFDPADSILFYGEAYEDKYTRDNVYWLTYGSAPGKRVGTRDVTPADGTLATSHTATTHLEQNVSYISILDGEDALERYVWGAAFNNGTTNTIWSTVFSVLDPVSAAGQLTITLAGANYSPSINPDHHAIIKINGTQVADNSWDGPTYTTIVAEIESGVLLDGNNTLSVTLPRDTGATYDYVYVDWAEISYPREFNAISDQLQFTYDTMGVSKFQIDELNTASPTLYDTTDPWTLVTLTGTEIQGSEAPYSLVFEDELDTPGSYAVTSATHYLAVGSIQLDTPSNLQTGSADYILITHSDFMTQAEAITDYRSGQGLRTALVDVRDIYDQFGYGIEGVEPIKAFLAYAYDLWTKPAPSFVFLVGSGNFDPKNYYGFGQPSKLPPYLAYVDTSSYPTTETAADNRYVTLVGEDNLPDMMLGRLPASTTGEVTAYFNKITSYESVPADASWKNKILAVADNADAAGNFSVVMESVLQCCVPPRYDAERVYLGIDPHTTGPLARAAIINGINAGKFLVNYQGHGAYSEWAEEGMLRYTDVGSLTNSSAFPIVLSMTCNIGYYIFPLPPGGPNDSLARLLTVSSAKGAIASWASTGTGLVTGHIPLNQGFYNAIFQDNSQTIGDATNKAKLDLWATSANLELIDTYLLFGDPALQITITPGAPTGYAPTGIVSLLNPTFTWSEIPNATYYNLVLFEEGGESARTTQDEITPEETGSTLILDQFVNADDVCAAGTCSFTPEPSLELAYGPYSWKVRALMGSDYTEFSSDVDFYNMSVSQPIQPLGVITNRNPKFVWSPVEEATQYKLRVSQGTTTIKEILVDSPSCPYTNCIYRSPTSLKLANGSYEFSVKAYVGSWGDYGLTIGFGIANPPSPKYPAISTTSPNPKFIWMKVADQTKYQVILYDSEGTVLLNEVMDPPLCGTARCRYVPDPELNLVNGTYKWKVRGYNNVWGNYSGLRTFEKVDPPAPISPAGTIKTANPEFTWVKIPGATKYAIKIQKPNGDTVKYLGVDASHCGTTYCNYVPDPSINLANGIYKWRVRAYNGYFGPYSDFLYFTKK